MNEKPSAHSRPSTYFASVAVNVNVSHSFEAKPTDGSITLSRTAQRYIILISNSRGGRGGGCGGG